ncbi:MAG: hypothetical protein NVV59_13950 [Chitinophagaceae bacterium]|nr:hypothetical protein [Chitinophagaceae bacterium]
MLPKHRPSLIVGNKKVKYVMDIDMNVETNQFTGKQKLEYWNNSPDTLTRVFLSSLF